MMSSIIINLVVTGCLLSAIKNVSSTYKNNISTHKNAIAMHPSLPPAPSNKEGSTYPPTEKPPRMRHSTFTIFGNSTAKCRTTTYTTTMMIIDGCLNLISPSI
jgi:hypothetical protein